MAVQYQIFTRYMNPTTSKIVSNKTKVQWYPNDFRTSGDYRDDQIESAEQAIAYSNSLTVKSEVIAVEEIFDSINADTTAEEVAEYYQKIIQETDLSNPKFDMLFVYNGLGHKITGEGDNAFEVYYDRILRTKLDPWFLHSVHDSYNSAVNTSKKLINIFGIDGVKVGKYVPLDTIIEIV